MKVTSPATTGGVLPEPIDLIDAMLIQRLHGDFPLSERPFDDVARQLAVSEDEVLARLRRMLDDGLLSHFGPLFQTEPAAGQFMLAAMQAIPRDVIEAAMQVPEERFDAVAAQVNALEAVVHNYRREHAFNMWFVLAATTPEAIQAARVFVEQETGLRVFVFPKEKEYFVALRLRVQRPWHKAPPP